MKFNQKTVCVSGQGNYQGTYQALRQGTYHALRQGTYQALQQRTFYLIFNAIDFDDDIYRLFHV